MIRSIKTLHNEISNLYSKQSNNKLSDVVLHSKFHPLLTKLDSPDFISTIIEQNLLDSDFMYYEWSNFDVPYLKIYSDSEIDLRYNLFFPNKAHESDKSSHMIHTHSECVLSSYVFYGPGYHTIHFDKNVVYKANQIVDLKLRKDFFHSLGNINVVECFEPHVLFNVSSPTFTIALWTHREKFSIDEYDGDHINYRGKYRSFYVKGNDVLTISDEEFLAECSFDRSAFMYEDYHIQAICYFIQQMGFDNYTLVKHILESKNLSFVWKKWLSRIMNGDQICYPYFNEELNFNLCPFKIDDIRKLCNEM